MQTSVADLRQVAGLLVWLVQVELENGVAVVPHLSAGGVVQSAIVAYQ